ncbi:MAG: hypothetical protein QOK09_1774, partial [Mycobacterium sp.]|nr:hypothetical protein [Mycobacterium sp.]
MELHNRTALVIGGTASDLALEVTVAIWSHG